MSTAEEVKRRMSRDVLKLIKSKHEVRVLDVNRLVVELHGPKETPYQGGTWKVFVKMSDDYPFKSPLIGFMNKIFHPNIDEPTGAVCMNVINYAWTPLYDLVNVFEAFLPQLLTYPNAEDPVNQEAAKLFQRDPKAFASKARDYVLTFAMPAIGPNLQPLLEKLTKATGDIALNSSTEAIEDDSDSSSLSDFGEDEQRA